MLSGLSPMSGGYRANLPGLSHVRGGYRTSVFGLSHDFSLNINIIRCHSEVCLLYNVAKHP